MQLTVENNTCLTPDSQDKSIYYLTLACESSAELAYQPGDWLTVAVKNPIELVQQLLQQLSLTGNEVIELRRIGEVSVTEALIQHLELTQLNPAILNKLQRQQNLGDWTGRQQMMDYAFGRDVLDLLELFPQLKTQGVEFLQLLSPLAPRYYSIASDSAEQNQVSILYKAVNYITEGRERFGVASNFLRQSQSGEQIEVEVKLNPTFKLPENPSTSIIMIGAGTGLAPFIGFMQHREKIQQTGQLLGENLLFFGETFEKTNCLFCDQLLTWQESGLLENSFAFSRDQEHKVYAQHRLLEQAGRLWDLIHKGAHIYICGSQNLLAESVKEAMLELFVSQGGMDNAQAEHFWQALRKEKRLQLDVY